MSEHQLAVLWVQLLALVVAARGLGLLFRRFSQPAVVGELSAGLLLGPSVFGKIWPSGFHWFLPKDAVQGGALISLTWVGAALLLVVTGFDTDLALIRRFGRASAMVATGSLVMPFAAGLAVGYLLPPAFMDHGKSQTVFALFIATAMSISSLPVIAKILTEMQLMRRNFGQINLAAGMVNDTVGWILLGIISGLASSGRISWSRIGLTIGGMALFLAVSFLVGQRLVDLALQRSRARHDTKDEAGVGSSLGIAVVVMVACAAAAQLLGLEAVLGAFVAGILLGRSRFQRSEVVTRIEGLTNTFLAPLFFATAGLRVDLSLLGRREVLLWSAVILLVASIGKFAGSTAGALAAGLPRREGLALGAGLNARGAMEIVIATVGLGLGVLNQAAFTAIVLMAMATSMAAPPSLRLALRNWHGSAEEQERLEREAAIERNVVVKDQRILLPSRGRPNSIVAAQLVHHAWPPEAPVTVLSVRDDGRVPDLTPVFNVLEEREHEERVVPADDVAETILAEAKLGFGLIGLGVDDKPQPGTVLSSLADTVLLEADVPVLIARRAHGLETALPGAFERMLVPASGTRASRAAQEVAFHLASNLGTEVVLAHVIDRDADDRGDKVAVGGVAQEEQMASRAQRVGAAKRVLQQAAGAARDLGVRPRGTVRRGASTADELMAAATEQECDLIVLGATARELDDRPFLGHLVEDVLLRADQTVVVIAVPPT